MYIEKCVIDSAWGDSTKTVYRFCKESPFARVLLPSKGKGITAAQRPITEYRREQGVKLGFNWRIFRIRGQASARLFEIDTNFWKSFFRQRLFTAMGDPGCFSVFGSDEEQHRLLAEHLSSEVAAVTSGGGRRVDIWKMIPGRENHWFDCAVGCMAAASLLGCDLSFDGILAKHRPAAKKPSEPSAAPAARRIVPTGRIVPHR
jgi:phage terminase large subunit GpA-like protein